MRTWIVVTNRSEAKVFSYNHRKESRVNFVISLKNPRGRLRSISINSDRPGIFANLESHGAKLVKAQSPTERIAQEFAKRVSDFLDDQLKKKKFDDLIIIADPHFIGRLRRLFSKELHVRVSQEIVKDLLGVTALDLENRLWPTRTVGAGGGT